MSKLSPTMTRTCFCQNCQKAGFPKKLTAYVIYGQTHGSYTLNLHAGIVPKNNLGLTPHIFFDDTLNFQSSTKEGQGYSVVKLLCGVLGCGYKIKYDGDERWNLFSAHEPDFAFMRSESFKHLPDYKDPDLYLNVANSTDWNIQEIVEEQQQLFRKLRRA